MHSTNFIAKDKENLVTDITVYKFNLKILIVEKKYTLGNGVFLMMFNDQQRGKDIIPHKKKNTVLLYFTLNI